MKRSTAILTLPDAGGAPSEAARQAAREILWQAKQLPNSFDTFDVTDAMLRAAYAVDGRRAPASGPLRLLGDPMLRQVAAPWSGDATALIKQLTATMRAHKGVGLAAPQIGESVRVVVVARDEHWQWGLVNPRITWRSAEEETAVEGCLSIPGYEVPVRRPKSVTIESDDRHGSPLTLHGIHARAAQHELDHLDGILILDRWLEQQRAGVTVAPDAGREAPEPPRSEVGVSTRRAMRAMEQIVTVMCEQGLRDDILLSEIQDYLSIAGYDVPLRSYAVDGRRAPPSGPPAQPKGSREC